MAKLPKVSVPKFDIKNMKFSFKLIRNLVICLIVLLIIAIGAFFFMQNAMKGASTQLVKLPGLEQGYVTEDGNAVRKVVIYYNLVVDSNPKHIVSIGDLTNCTREVMATLDYEKIKGTDNIDYVRNMTLSGLQGYFEDGYVKDVIVVDVFTGKLAAIYAPAPTSNIPIKN